MFSTLYDIALNFIYNNWHRHNNKNTRKEDKMKAKPLTGFTDILNNDIQCGDLLNIVELYLQIKRNLHLYISDRPIHY